MICQIRFDGKTLSLLRHLPPVRKQRIKESLREIAQDPFLGKSLEEDLSGYYSYRVGSFRIIYSIERSKREVHIVAIGPRRIIYEELEKELLTKKK